MLTSILESVGESDHPRNANPSTYVASAAASASLPRGGSVESSSQDPFQNGFLCDRMESFDAEASALDDGVPVKREIDSEEPVRKWPQCLGGRSSEVIVVTESDTD